MMTNECDHVEVMETTSTLFMRWKRIMNSSTIIAQLTLTNQARWMRGVIQHCAMTDDVHGELEF